MTRQARVRGVTVAVLVAFCAGATSLVAQETRGTILGRITDPSGATLNGAKVTVTNEASNVSVETMSNAAGNYNVPFLTPGTYAVRVELVGFKASTRSGVTVQVADRVSLNFTLEVGVVTEVITITAETPLLQRNNADMGQVIDRHFLSRLPINGTTAFLVADMAPGVISAVETQANYSNNFQADISINGGIGGFGSSGRGNDVSIDGVPAATNRQGGVAANVPSPDAIEEFKVQTTMFDATLGRSNAGAIAFTTRGGTNQFHGTSYYFRRDPGMNANSWTNNRSGQKRPQLEKSNYGGSFGGPLLLPGYNGHDKTFFFLAFDRIVDASPQPSLARVPTALERAGDFSQTLTARGNPIEIYDPLSTVVSPTGGFVSRTPFAGAKIPQDRLSPIGLAVLSQFPLPNVEGPARLGTPNWAFPGVNKLFAKNVNARLDHQLSPKQRLYARVSWIDSRQGPFPVPFPGSINIPGTAQNFDTKTQTGVAIDDTVTFSSTFVGSFRLGYSRSRGSNTHDGIGRDPSLLKIPSVLIDHQKAPEKAWPTFDASNDGLPVLGSRKNGTIDHVYSFLGNFNKLAGNHSMRFGVDYRMIRMNRVEASDAQNGRFVFNKTLTRLNPTQSSSEDTSGSAMASMLLGLPNTGSLANPADLANQSHYFSVFFQDDCRVSSRVTLNFGVRYELETPVVERYNRLVSGFDPSADLGITVPGIGPLKGGLTFASADHRSFGPTDYTNFGPRVGFNYSLGDKTVLRGGYGIFYAPLTAIEGELSALSTFGSVTPYIGSTTGDITVIPGVSLSNPFPNGFVQPTGASAGLRTLLGETITAVNPDRVVPYTHQWQLGVQRELPWQMKLEVAYVGSNALKLFGGSGSTHSLNANEIPDASRRDRALVTNPFSGVLPATSALGGSTIQANRLAVRYPQFSSVNLLGMNTDSNIYHGVQAALQKRFSNGVAFVLHYTFSKAIYDDATSIVNVRQFRTVSAADRSHTFRAFTTIDLPFGHGRSLGAHWSGPLNTVLGGWSLTWIARVTSGVALGVTDSGRERPIPNGADPYTSGATKDRLGDVKNANGIPTNPYFNINAFTRLPDGDTVTTSPPRWGWFRGPRQIQNDASLFKSFSITHGVQLELHADVQNPFNSPIFDNPATNVSNAATFGVITNTVTNTERRLLVGAKLRF